MCHLTFIPLMDMGMFFARTPILFFNSFPDEKNELCFCPSLFYLPAAGRLPGSEGQCVTCPTTERDKRLRLRQCH